jgi:predicted nucleic acid-binding protein
MPVRPMPSPLEVGQLLRESVLPHVQIVELSRADYERALEVVSTRLLRSGAIFDALIETAARRSRVRHLLTLNTDDFRRLSEKTDDWLIDPRLRPIG